MKRLSLSALQAYILLYTSLFNEYTPPPKPNGLIFAFGSPTNLSIFAKSIYHP